MNKQTREPSHPMGIKPLPYGLTNFGRIRSENYYYIDKTSFIPALEKAGSYLFFIRPRRFGKTLFISMLESYYDVTYKDHFEEFFKDTTIYGNPTKEKNSYLILSFDFSQVEPTWDKLENSFLLHVRGQVDLFLKKYKNYFGTDGEELINEIKEIHSAADILSALSRLCRANHVKSYVIIDEYDNFANTILSSSGQVAYHDLTHGEGFYRAFFNILKGGTSRMEAPFTRIFLTGVSPVTMDDVTSGYNIGTNISLEHRFNRMLGFTQEDITQMIAYYRSHGLIKDTTPFLLETLTQWYGNYLFSEDDSVRMYNSDMILYFLNNYISRGKFPKNLVDRNVRIDYEKLRHLIILEKEKKLTTNGNFVRLRDILEKGSIYAVLQEGFPLKGITDPDNFISLLFYFGLLTIQDSELDTLQLVIPNEVMRRLFYDYIKMVYDETGAFSFDLSKYTNLMKNMALNGVWKPFFEFLTGRMKESLSLRDLITGEKAIQTFLNVYLGLSNLYIIQTEQEANKGYADIVMEPFLAQYPDIKYAYMIEIKYMKRAAAQAAAQPPSKAAARPPSKTAAEQANKPSAQEIQKLVAEAEAQLSQYSLDEKLAKTLAPTTLIKIILVFCGHEAVYIGTL